MKFSFTWIKTNPVAEAKTPREKDMPKAVRGTESFVHCKGCHTGSGGKVKVHLTPKMFFRLNKFRYHLEHFFAKIF